jgi:hypothetical protein
MYELFEYHLLDEYEGISCFVYYITENDIIKYYKSESGDWINAFGNSKLLKSDDIIWIKSLTEEELFLEIL